MGLGEGEGHPEPTAHHAKYSLTPVFCRGVVFPGSSGPIELNNHVWSYSLLYHFKIAQAVWRRARPVPHALRPAVDAELQRLQHEGIISPVEWSEWGTLVVPVVKQNGQVRLCGDFKTTLNPVLMDDKYSIPRIESIFSALQGGEIFAKIDFSNAYLQILLDKFSKRLCTIVTQQGIFCFNRLPFGIKCTPNKFQRLMT
ncbi:uncharacterized protein K02A2.6-like [Achroia grisella]|uniref:uncharacterized protein K02A2.6-like n=1 Tax=Achroia grisella TaxID=688607 RepID=UPI0027D34A06|nr:uncharacterized protein K02A2.6-like [Achroia grisella]